MHEKFNKRFMKFAEIKMKTKNKLFIKWPLVKFENVTNKMP